ncbi:hypothetical protein [Anaerotignum sp.]|uniref:hypothetical protein n=1 Tax=Anaerotignum sp. TaxID=2039241 RepID=UPI00399558A5
MTWQSLIFLKQLKTVQKTDHGMIWIDNENRKLMTIIHAKEEQKSLDFSQVHGDVWLMVNYLQDRNMVEKLNYSTIRLTHSGFHFSQVIFSELCSFLVRSIFVPIGVSVVTTLCMFFLERFMQ